MPHLVQMDRKLKKKGLVIIAQEAQGSSEEDIMKLVKDNKLKYTITKRGTGPSIVKGLPTTAVFDVKGKLIYIGRTLQPETEKAIKTALKAATPDEESSTSSSGLTARKKDLVAMRNWTNTDGNVLKASLTKVVGTTGHFKRVNGQKFEYDTSKLSAADQDVIKAATEATAAE